MTTPMSPESAQTPGAPAPDGQQPVPRSASFASLLLVSVALLAGAAGTFMFLSAHPSAGTVRADDANHVAGSAGSPNAGTPTAVVTAPAHQWSRDDEYRWIANHKRSVAYTLDANQQVRVWTTHVRPSLVVRCLNKKTEVFVYTESPSKMESTDGLHSVRLTFDDAAESDERWPDSSEHDALFAPDGTELARRISTAHHLRFGFSPHNADPVQVDFDLGDAGSVVSHVAKTCGWH